MSRVRMCSAGLLVGMGFMMLLLAGCGICPEPAPKPVVKAPEPPCEPCGKAGMIKVARYLPSDEKKCATVLVEKAAPERVMVGETFEYHIGVTNMTKADLLDVTVWDTILPNYKMTKSTPEVSGMKDGWTSWKLGKMGPGESRLIKLEGMATGECILRPCAEVTYRMAPVCIEVGVVQPSLMVTKTAPSEILVCDPMTMRFLVKNIGTGQACNVVIRDDLAKGLTTLDDKQQLMFAAGTLNAGESREFTAQVKAAKTGTYTNRAVATADGGLRAESETTTTEVVKPELSVTKTGPDMRYIGVPVTYTITVMNGPEATASNTVLTDTIPAGATFVSASDGGKQAGDKVTWDLGTLKPRDTRKVTVTMKADSPGVLRNNVEVTASCGEAKGQAVTTIKGIPAILLECVDLQDPIEVGSNVTYQITVTNQGSAVGTNIVVECLVPVPQEYVSSSGPTQGAAKAQVVTFAPLPTLAPKAKAVYTVVVKAVDACDCRFKVTLKSDQMTAPAEETESTTFYK